MGDTKTSTTATGDTMSLRVSKDGVRSPYWLIAATISAVVFVVSLAVESRFRLASQGESLERIQTSVSKLGVLEHRVNRLEQETTEIKVHRSQVGRKIERIETNLALICAKLDAKCLTGGTQ